jgi:hypothetical protein
MTEQQVQDNQTFLDKLTKDTTTVASLAIKLTQALPTSTALSKYVGLLSAAAGLATEWLKSLPEGDQRMELADSLAVRALGVADVLIMVGKGDTSLLEQSDKVQ